MTSTNLRNRKPNPTFPYPTLKRKLSMISDSEEMGRFHLDKIGIALDKPWQIEDIPGEQLFFTKYKTGFCYHREFQGNSYEIFVGKGRNRTILVNPRHFESWKALDAFLERILRGRCYHITRVDFAFFANKDLFTVDFFVASLWKKNSKVFCLEQYKDPIHFKVNRARYVRYIVGNNKYRIHIYDTDVGGPQRPPSKQISHSINLEVQFRTEYLRKLGVSQLVDFLRLDASQVFRDLSFIEPSRSALRDSKYSRYQVLWEDEGLIELKRALYFESGKHYSRVENLFNPLMVRNRSFSEALIALANEDLINFREGKSFKHRSKQEHIAYSMNVLFPD